ncbi:ABC transporter ATP-binding protein [Thermodesulforhabdus norvegica]|uniref:Amino acid/amide ABC transporter ATP-binding protein 1, HAAT family n=1 Tax=Thermodesulforhabdus norvegica TaxID=39841 RepID=A0A1I4TNZ1_9BACT|nr:ABC transporter ATP-binding protein [Thermodesulforhabdus norvegica]SFM78508.1 amino acid/amide ABC transporter ATP-binding protein 1, HAAT family [Thermodesulforhabdus norvegica]
MQASRGEILLQVNGVSHRYGDFVALQDVNIKIPWGQLTALIGPNGAGKTTFYNVVSGKFRPTSGRIIFKNKDITGYPPHRLFRMGLARSFQITNTFGNLTVLENVMVPIILRNGKGFRIWSSVKKDRYSRDEALGILELVGLEELSRKFVRELSYGDRRLLEIAIVLAGKPDMVLLDEPTAGMTPEETDKTINLIKHLANTTGITFFLTEHDMKVVFSVAEYIYVLHQGRLLAQGKPLEIRENEQVKEAYLGGALDS